jgi:hypothetical protein
MTILQFQQLYFITKSKDIDFDKSIKMVGVVTGQTPEEVEKLPMKQFNRICSSIQKKFEIFNKDLLKGRPKSLVMVKGRIYRLHYRVDRFPINAARYVETITFGKDLVNNLHKIMASIATPVNWMGKAKERLHEDIATDFESMDFEAAYHAAVFFYTHYRVSMQIIQPYLIQKLMAKGVNQMEAEVTLNNSLTALDGFTMPNWSVNLKTYLLSRFGSWG